MRLGATHAKATSVRSESCLRWEDLAGDDSGWRQALVVVGIIEVGLKRRFGRKRSCTGTCSTDIGAPRRPNKVGNSRPADEATLYGTHRLSRSDSLVG